MWVGFGAAGETYHGWDGQKMPLSIGIHITSSHNMRLEGASCTKFVEKCLTILAQSKQTLPVWKNIVIFEYEY